MIELTFGESAAGALKLAKSMKHGARMEGVVGIIGDDQDRSSAMESRVWCGESMEGSSNDVVSLMLALDIGDLSDIEGDMRTRKQVLDMLFGDYDDVPDGIWQTNQRTLERLRNAKQTNEPLRIWASESDPAEMCGLYFVCDMMRGVDIQLSAVHIPRCVESGNEMAHYRSTGEIKPEALGALVRQEHRLTELERRIYANRWRELAQENAPLRAIVNGDVLGVPDTFYDFAIRANIPENEFVVARLIGKTLGRVGGVGDRWLYLRIVQMLRTGELVEVERASSEHPYSGVVKWGDIW